MRKEPSPLCDAGSPLEREAGNRRVTVVACGAIASDLRAVLRHRAVGSTAIEVCTLPALLHNRPRLIAGEVTKLVRELQSKGRTVVVAYADCGTYGALDEVCSTLGVQRLPGLHCYDLFAGSGQVEHLFEDEPGTYLLTDFLVRSFGRTVMSELGLDRHPELWADYFGHYRRVVWLAQRPTADLGLQAAAIAEKFGLPLEIVETGVSGLAAELDQVLERVFEQTIA